MKTSYAPYGPQAPGVTPKHYQMEPQNKGKNKK